MLALDFAPTMGNQFLKTGAAIKQINNLSRYFYVRRFDKGLKSHVINLPEASFIKFEYSCIRGDHAILADLITLLSFVNYAISIRLVSSSALIRVKNCWCH